MEIKVYTDGSCHTQLLIGAWASILFIDQQKIVLKGVENDTTHNRMEITAVIKAIDCLELLDPGVNKILIHSDSQYVVNLPLRLEKIQQNNFLTKSGKSLPNADLLNIFALKIKNHDLEFVKIKAHQKNGDRYNREVDLLVRKTLRENIER